MEGHALGPLALPLPLPCRETVSSIEVGFFRPRLVFCDTSACLEPFVSPRPLLCRREVPLSSVRGLLAGGGRGAKKAHGRREDPRQASREGRGGALIGPSRRLRRPPDKTEPPLEGRLLALVENRCPVPLLIPRALQPRHRLLGQGPPRRGSGRVHG